MQERDLFLNTIANQPDDIALRLVYADWLKEQDNPEGEFIELHCAFEECWAKLVYNGNTLATEQEINIHKRWRAWLAAYGQERLRYLQSMLRAWEFRGGLISGIVVEASVLANYAEVIGRLGYIHHLRLLTTDMNPTTVVDYLAQIKQIAWLSRVRCFDLSGWQPNAPLSASLAPYWAAVRQVAKGSVFAEGTSILLPAYPAHKPTEPWRQSFRPMKNLWPRKPFSKNWPGPTRK